MRSMAPCTRTASGHATSAGKRRRRTSPRRSSAASSARVLTATPQRAVPRFKPRQRPESIMKAAELLVKCLENEGVEYVFGIPGEENIDIMDALLDSRIRFVTTRHEQGAAFMADVYGRL